MQAPTRVAVAALIAVATLPIAVLGPATALPPSTVLAFDPAIHVPVQPQPNWLVVGDFDQDGHLDAVTNSRSGSVVQVLLGDGTGNLSLFSTTPVAGSLTEGQVADVNGDGYPDIVTADIFQDTITVLLNDTTGALVVAATYPTGAFNPNSIAMGDLDGDGDVDLVIGIPSGVLEVETFLNDGSGVFTQIPGGVPVCNTSIIDLADLDGDTVLDLIVSGGNCYTEYVALGVGDGTFGPPVAYPLTGYPIGIAVGDYDEDGLPDLAIGMIYTGDVAVLTNLGGGSFSAPSYYSGSTSNWLGRVATADFDGDSHLDIVGMDGHSTTVNVLQGDGTGSLMPLVPLASGNQPFALDLGDFDGDGRVDIIGTNYDDGDIVIFLNRSSVLTPPTLTLPAPITVETEGPDGSVVDYVVTVTDDKPGATFVCLPPSGSIFPLGTTTVTCTATDSDGLVTNGSFDITVIDTIRADLALEKTADLAKASPGQNVTYTLTVTNLGPSSATGVVVTDPLPAALIFQSGDPGCSFASGMLTCQIGTLSSGASAAVQFVAKLSPSHSSADPPTDHQLSVTKVEQTMELAAHQPGRYDAATLRCPAGQVMTDASARVDSVDQGAGGPGLVHVVRSRADAGDPAAWDFRVQNHATGRVQLHLFGVCVAPSSTDTAGHSHGLNVTGPITQTLLGAAAGSRVEQNLSCAPGQVAVAPGHDFATTPGRSHGSQFRSAPTADAGAWRFGFQIPSSAPADLTLSIRCLDVRTTTVAGHQHLLRITDTHQRVLVAPSDPSSSQPFTDQRASCPGDAKGIVGAYDLAGGLLSIGNTPEPINRDFRLHNPTVRSLYGHLGLVCLGNRIGGTGTTGGSVDNQASVHGDQPDWVAANDLDTYTLEDPPITVALRSARVDGRRVLVRLACKSLKPCRGTISAVARIRGSHRDLGRRTFVVEAGSARAPTLTLSRRDTRAVHSSHLRWLRVTMRTRQGQTVTVRVPRRLIN